MSSAVVNLAERRELRALKRAVEARADLGLDLSRPARAETARIALAELQMRYEGILNIIREPLLEMIEWVRVEQLLSGSAENLSYASCVALALLDLRHLGEEWHERVDARRAELPEACERFAQMQLL